jgi:hypothetical protein
MPDAPWWWTEVKRMSHYDESEKGAEREVSQAHVFVTSFPPTISLPPSFLAIPASTLNAYSASRLETIKNLPNGS